ncbi:MAG: hypothetical protein AB7P03_13660 [Kofleriaceae bacterium]
MIDRSYITSGGTVLAENWIGSRHIQRIFELPPDPSIYFHPGTEAGSPMPIVTRPDGTTVAIVRIVEVPSSDSAWGESPLLRIDLNVNDGIVFARADERDPPDVYLVSATFKPSTHFVVEETGGVDCLTLGSNAALFRIERPGRVTVSRYPPSWQCGLDIGNDPDADSMRVIAIYPDRSTQLVFQHGPDFATDPPASPAPRWPLAVAMLFPLACLLARRRMATSSAV